MRTHLSITFKENHFIFAVFNSNAALKIGKFHYFKTPKAVNPARIDKVDVWDQGISNMKV